MFANKFWMSAAGATLLAFSSLPLFNNAASAATFGTSWDGEEYSLQNLLDGVTTAGPNIDTVADESPVEKWVSTAIGGSFSRLMFEVAGYKDGNIFGMYNSSGQYVPIFGGSASPTNFGSSKAEIYFLDDNSVDVNGTNYAGFGNQFGFYLKNAVGSVFHTEKSKNGGAEQAVVYQGNGQTQLDLPFTQPGVFDTEDWIIAFEDLSLMGSDRDYNDMVVMVSDLHSAVPEPATMAGLAVVGGAMALSRRRQAKKS